MGALSKLVLAGSLLLGACGGSSDSPPGPLARHFDDMYIAQVPMDQRQEVVNSQNDWSLAKMQNAKAEADFNDSTTAITLARNDLAASKIAVNSAMTNKKAAQASNDNNKINQAVKDEQTAEHLQKAAEARVKFLEAWRDYLKTQWRFAQEDMYWKESRYELAKSKLAQKNNVSPKGVDYKWYGPQEEERGKRATNWKGKLADKKNAAKSAHDNWATLQKNADTENGHPTSLPDPMSAPQATDAQN